MATRRHLALVLCSLLASMGASYRTANFLIEAPTPQMAQQAGQYAEHYRREKALQWLNQEMPPWPQPCPVKITVTMGGAGGATTFAYDRGRVLDQNMHIEGSYERLMNSVLPHEITHTVFAYYFRCPSPRWSDEGGAVLSEDDVERNRHDMLCRQILNTPGRAIPLRRLFALKDYPGDVMALYAEGFSVTNFLVGLGGRQQFLGFVATGMREGWDRAAHSYYRFSSVEELEKAWIQHLRDNRQPATQLANTARPAENEPGRRILVRNTVPPAEPGDGGAQPVYRGQMGDDGNQDPQRLAGGARPGYLPDYGQAPRPPAPQPGTQDGWQPVPPPPNVRLGPPEFPPPGQAMPGPVSPVGYSQ
jgi:hypothetical protein